MKIPLKLNNTFSFFPNNSTTTPAMETGSCRTCSGVKVLIGK